MLYAVVGDMSTKEHFVETYWDDDTYLNTRKDRIESGSNLRFQSIFSTYKEAIREAKRISKPTYVEGWKYNEERNTVGHVDIAE